jgi:transposase
MEAPCQGCRERDAVIAALQEQVANLQRRLEKLEAQVRGERNPQNNSSNSSVPPSANPLDAPKLPRKKPSGRKPGGQPGHALHQRPRLPADETIHCRPETCGSCQAALPRRLADELEPRWHQIVEIPQKLYHVIEYQAHACTCKRCGAVTWGKIPPEALAYGYGPRFTAIVSYLSGCHHVSKRGVEEVFETVFTVPIALGTVINLEQQVSAALAPIHEQAAQIVRQAPVKNVDETSWKQAGQLRWLWTAATNFVSLFVIHPCRGLAGLATLLGTTFSGIICSDRWSAYRHLPSRLRQICWAHLKRDFQKCVDRDGKMSKVVGAIGLDLVQDIFALWHSYRGGSIDRPMLQTHLQPVMRDLREVLEAGAGCAKETKLATFCSNLLAIEPALWTFAVEEGVEPTNNHAERVLRKGVLWRKNAFGSHSERGCRFVERILTVIQTLRLQKRPVLDFIHDAVVAYRSEQPAPQILVEA